MVILLVALQMLSQRVDSRGENCDLNLGRTGIALVGLEGLDNFLLLFFLKHGVHLRLNLFPAALPKVWRLTAVYGFVL
jgi:hypothetical protein